MDIHTKVFKGLMGAKHSQLVEVLMEIYENKDERFSPLIERLAGLETEE